jgi:hypothetical protein
MVRNHQFELRELLDRQVSRLRQIQTELSLNTMPNRCRSRRESNDHALVAIKLLVAIYRHHPGTSSRGRGVQHDGGTP